jgi:hypothetical protein
MSLQTVKRCSFKPGSQATDANDSHQRMKGCESTSSHSRKMHSDRTVILLGLYQRSLIPAIRIWKSRIDKSLQPSPVSSTFLGIKIDYRLNLIKQSAPITRMQGMQGTSLGCNRCRNANSNHWTGEQSKITSASSNAARE